MKGTIFCPTCLKEVTYNTKEVKEIYPVKGEEVEINATVSFCDCCGNEIWNDDLDSDNLKRAFDVFRKKHGLLTAEQIKAIRTKYEVSQSCFARALGLGEKTITRYERGSLQDRAHNGLISLAEKPDAFKHLVEMNKEMLSSSELKALLDKCDGYRVKVLSVETDETTIKYNTRSTYKYNSYPCYFGGLNDAG